MTYLEQLTDKRILLNYGIIGCETELTKARKRREIALDKLKKVELRMANPKIRTRYAHDVHLANQEIVAWERRIELGKRMFGEVE